MYQYVTAEQWQEFEQKFPAAVSFLIHHDLTGELRVLRAEVKNMEGLKNSRVKWESFDWERSGRCAWVKNRIQELEWGLEGGPTPDPWPSETKDQK